MWQKSAENCSPLSVGRLVSDFLSRLIRNRELRDSYSELALTRGSKRFDTRHDRQWSIAFSFGRRDSERCSRRIFAGMVERPHGSGRVEQDEAIRAGNIQAAVV